LNKENIKNDNDIKNKNSKPKIEQKIIIINSQRQKENPLIEFIKNVKIEYKEDIIPDYIIGKNSSLLFLSLKYHVDNPKYIINRIKELNNLFNLRVVLCLVDIVLLFLINISG
jgi:DNA excision repair protein ERCC-1